MKVCTKCGESLPENSFGKYKKAKDGLYPRCKECRKEDTAEYRKRHSAAIKQRQRMAYRENPEKYAEKHKAWREKNKERVAEKRKKYYRDNRSKLIKYAKNYAAHPANKYRAWVKNISKFNITADEYIKLFDEQLGACAICDGPLEGNGHSPHIDHNHVTGEVRGLLCHCCNTGVGLLNDNPIVLMNAIRYLNERGYYGEDSR